MEPGYSITKDQLNPRYALIAGFASIVTVLILIAAKALTYGHTGSASVLASLVDSLADITVSMMSLLAIRFSLKPPDRSHRSGHGKIEGLAALVQAAFIAMAGVALVYESGRRFMNPEPVSDHGLAIGVMLFAIILSAALVSFQSHVLKKAPSLAVEADRAHYSMDIAINGGVIVILLALYFGGPLWLDPLFALAVAGWLALTVRDIAMKGMDMLLDRELPNSVREQIIEIVRAQDGVKGVHDLRTTKSGMRIFMSFDIEADPELSLREAHAIARAVEHALLEPFPHADIMIHVDPYGDTEDSRHTVKEIHK